MDFVLGADHLNDDFERYLDNFTQKFGYGDPDACVCILFYDSVDEYDQLYELPRVLDEDHVYVSKGFDIESYAYLDFQTFYDYLAQKVLTRYRKSKDPSLLEKLDAVCQGLGVTHDIKSIRKVMLGKQLRQLIARFSPGLKTRF